MIDELKVFGSQCHIIGAPHPQTWADYRNCCHATFGGGHHSVEARNAFHHGMDTVFNLLEAEFPPAEACKVLMDKQP